MKSHTLTLATALIVLFSQLLTLNPVFSFSSYTYGAFSDAVEKVTVVQRHVVYEAVFASAPAIKYEALVFTGDIMLGRNVEYLMGKEKMAYPFMGFDSKSLYQNAAVIGNFESSMSPEHAQTPAYAMKFSVAEATLPELKAANFTHVSLANNHSLDFGIPGYKNARQKLLEHSLMPFGSSDAISCVPADT